MKGKGMKVTWLVFGIRSTKQTRTGRVIKIKDNREWQKRHGLDARSGANSMLSMHFYQFLNTEESNASIITLQFPQIRQKTEAEEKQIKKEEKKEADDSQLSMQKRNAFGSFISAKSQGRDSNSKSLEDLFTADLMEYNSNYFYPFTLYLSLVIGMSGILTIGLFPTISDLVQTGLGITLLTLHSICLFILISGVLIQRTMLIRFNLEEGQRKFGKYLYKLQKGTCSLCCSDIMTFSDVAS